MSKKESRQKPLTDEEYKAKSKPRGAFASIWEPETDEFPYSCHKFKVAGLAGVRASKGES